MKFNWNWKTAVLWDGNDPPAPTPTPQPPTPAPAPAPASTPAPPEEVRKPWYLERIDQLTGKNHELLAENATLKSQTTAKPAGPTVAPGEKIYTAQEVQQLIAKGAQEVASTTAFNDKCNQIYDEGKTAHTDYDAKIAILNKMAGGTISRDLVEAAIEAGSTSELLYKLGSEPDLAQEILALSPAKQAVRLAKLADEIKKPEPKRVSNAPAPITPKDTPFSQGEKQLDDPAVNTAEWMEMRNKQVAERKKARGY